MTVTITLQHWRTYHNATVYTWGKGQWYQLGHSTDTVSLPAKADCLGEVEQVMFLQAGIFPSDCD